jgi:hypothetical protein
MGERGGRRLRIGGRGGWKTVLGRGIFGEGRAALVAGSLAVYYLVDRREMRAIERRTPAAEE